MKKTSLRLLCLLLCLLLCSCVAPPVETTPQTAQTLPAPTEPPETEPPTEADAGLIGVQPELPETLTATPDAPAPIFKVRFTNVDPTGAPPEGRLCTLIFSRDGEVVSTDGQFLLTEGAEAELTTQYDFYRYMPQTSSELTVELRYRLHRIRASVEVRLENQPDELYAAETGDPRPYAISILKNHNVVIVYGKDDNGEYTMPAKVFTCSAGNSTPRGTYSLGSRHVWSSLFGGVYGQYAIVITGNILFHSVPYRRRSKDSLETDEYNKLGELASLGCIRLAVADAKWIYDYCPRGTSVKIFNADELPVEKPTPIRIDEDSPYAGWDPTDPDEENPWNGQGTDLTPNS